MRIPRFYTGNYFKSMDEESLRKHLEVVQHGFRENFQGGNRLALLDCIRWCDDYGLSLPTWALQALSRVAGQYLEKKKDTLDEALFGSKVRHGRLAHPATSRRQVRNDQLTFDTVFALRKKGFKGDLLYERAHELLGTMCLDSDNRLAVGTQQRARVLLPESIKKKYEAMKRRQVRPSGFAHLIPMMVDLDDPPRRGKK